MKIYQTKEAPNPRRLRIFLAEKKIDIEFEELDLMAGNLKSEAFTSLNPMQRVPLLQLDDGECISESMAICRYFEELQPQPGLFGNSALERARVEMWNRRVELGLFFHVAQVFRHGHPAMAHLEVPQVGEWGKSNVPRALEQLAMLNDALAGRQYLAGDEFSVSDITALVAIDFMKPARIVRPAELSHLARWYDDVSQRPSAGA